MNIFQEQYDPQFMKAVNFAALHKLKDYGVKYLGRYVFIPDKPLESPDSDAPSKQKVSKPRKFFNSITKGLSSFASKLEHAVNGTIDPAAEYKKDNSILNDPKKSQPCFLTPEKELQDGMRTLFHLYQFKDQTFAVFNPTTNPAQNVDGKPVYGRRNCIPVDYALNLFFKKFQLNDPDYVMPDVLLVPMSWRDLQDDDDPFEWSLLKITPPKTYKKGTNTNIDTSDTEIIMYLDHDNEAHRKSMRTVLKEFSSFKTVVDEEQNITVTGPRWADHFNLRHATVTPDGGPWVNKNIRTIIVGDEPKSTHIIDIREQYSHYYEWLGYGETGEFLKQKPISTWKQYRGPIVIIAAILVLAVIVGAFSLGFPGAFAGLIYGLGAMFNVSAAAIGALTVAQTALITAAFVATVSALTVTVGSLIKGGIDYIRTRKSTALEQAAKKLQDYQQSSDETSNHGATVLPSIQETLNNVHPPSSTTPPRQPNSSESKDAGASYKPYAQPTI